MDGTYSVGWCWGGSTVNFSVNEPFTRCTVGVGPTRSLRRLLPGHWMGPWVGRLVWTMAERAWDSENSEIYASVP